MNKREARRVVRALIEAERAIKRSGDVEAFDHIVMAKRAIIRKVESPIRLLWQAAKRWRRRQPRI